VPGDVHVRAAVGSNLYADVTVHVIDAVAPPASTPAAKNWLPGGYVDPGTAFGRTVVSIDKPGAVNGVTPPVYSASGYLATDRWVFRLNSISHTYKLGIHIPPCHPDREGLRGIVCNVDLGDGPIPDPFPVPPGKAYDLITAHNWARYDLDTAAMRNGAPGDPDFYTYARLFEYFVNAAIVAHENDHVAHFYGPAFGFWDAQMNLFQSNDVEDPTVFVVYDCTDPSTTSQATALARMQPSWNVSIAAKHLKADTDELPTSELHAYTVAEKPIEDAARARIPIP
jgi:hypothetical protein